MARKTRVKLAVHAVFHCAVCCLLMSAVSHGQSAEPQSPKARTAEVADSLAKVKSGKFNSYHVEVIGEARVVEAIPDLEKQFTVVSDPLDRAKIAQVLLSLGDKKDVYWNYLEELAKPALESEAPDPTPYDADGKQIPGLSQAFVEWAQAHGELPDEAGMNAVYIWPGFMMLLGASGDSRALPLLQRAMSSRNPMIQIAASSGLAEMHDVVSVPMMVMKCKEARPDVASLIAESLVFFDDPEAQKAVDLYLSKEMAKALRDSKAAGRGPLRR